MSNAVFQSKRALEPEPLEKIALVRDPCAIRLPTPNHAPGREGGSHARKASKIRDIAWLYALGAVLGLPLSAAAQEGPSTLRRFATEAVGGTAGSVVGVAIGFVIADPGECDSEDIACILNRVGLAGVLAAAGAPVATTLIGRVQGTEPSILGAAFGSVAGVALGVGMIKLADEAGASLGSLGAGIIFTLSHGAVTAVGSRVAAALR